MSGNDDDLWSEADEDALAQLGLDLDLEDSDHLSNVENEIDGLRNANDTLSKFSLECDKILERDGTPLQRYRPNYAIVSDFASQHWCEQKLLYNFSLEVYLSRAEPGVDVKVQEDIQAKVAKGKGSDIHLSRELEIQVPIEVPVETKEDKWAIKFHNLQAAVTNFLHGQRLAREVPVFGCPFDEQIFIFGIVDEISYDPSTHCLDISELKTRRSLRLPKRSHQEKDKIQLGLYRQLFDELVLGKVTKQMIQHHLKIDLNRPLSKDVASLFSDADVNEHDININSILDTLLIQIQKMTCIRSGRVEYVHQETKAQIACIDLDKDTEEVKKDFAFLCQWWRAERGTQGVDIEDCWKCEFCEFSELCEWRDFMAAKTSKSILKKS